ncbi:MAG: methyltransferase domain-containing protein [Alphaproteobacteria bacterium]|nr:MAG: methyltransferase domain-containing protein [Alphaproteobacteria bacterium]
MKIELAGIPFDHFQRYATAASVLRTFGTSARVLEVGANRQRLLGEFLPDSELLYTDVLNEDGAPDFVVADARELPFGDRSYDAVVSLDVLEHIPPEGRYRAVEEMCRVAARVLVIGCPIDQPWVHEAEHAAHAVWRRYFDEAYPWLEEHQEFGLVEPARVEAALTASGMSCVRFGHGDARLWVTLMGMHFVKEAIPELAGVVASADRYYNTAMFEGDRGDECYREFFVGVRNGADLESIRSAAVLNGAPDAAGAALLAGLSDALLPLVARLRRAESEWQDTAQALADTEKRLQDAAMDRHKTGVDAQAATREALVQLEYAKKQWESTARALADTENRLQLEASLRHQQGVDAQNAASQALAQLEYANDQWQQTARLLADAERRMQAEALAHHETGLQLRDVAEREVALRALSDGLSKDLEAAERADACYRDQLNALSARIKGLERRQRIALVLFCVGLFGTAIAFLTIGA